MRTNLSLWISVIAISVACRAQQPVPSSNPLTEVLANMASQDMATRHAGLDNFIKMISKGQELAFDPEYPRVLATFFDQHPDQIEPVKLGLIDLLQADNNAFTDRKAAPGTYTERDTEHWATAIGLVSSLNDERAIPVLVGAMTTGGMAMNGILKYGQKALEPVLSKLNDPDPLVRSRALATAIVILQMKNDRASHARVVSIIRAGLTDVEFLVRSSALGAIETLADKAQFVPALQGIRDHDPFIVPGQTNYPLRTRADRLLQEITKP